jgi:hypothetical protein
MYNDAGQKSRGKARRGRGFRTGRVFGVTGIAGGKYKRIWYYICSLFYQEKL